jgi:hypothetical protein
MEEQHDIFMMEAYLEPFDGSIFMNNDQGVGVPEGSEGPCRMAPIRKRNS